MPSDWFRTKRTRDGIPLDEIFDSSYAELVCELVGVGAMVSAGATRDGGACHLTVYFGGEKRREYVECREDMLDFLGGAVRALTETPPPTPTPIKARSRKAAPQGA